MDEATWLDKVRGRLSQLSSLQARMDIDRNLIYNTPYVMPSLLFKNDQEKDIANVSLPLGKLYCEAAIASLNAMTRQVVVDSDEMTDKATSRIENLISDLSYEIDSQLGIMGESSEFATLIDLLCSRGSAAELNLLRIEDGKLITDVRPLDTRWFSWEFGRDGLAWGAPVYNRDAGDIKSEYGIDINSKEAEVIDLWTPDSEITWVAGQVVRNQANPYRFVPIVFQGVSLGSALKERQAIQYKWESIFATSRNLFQEANFIASILKTQNYGAVKPAQQMAPKADGTPATTPPNYPASATITATDSLMQPVNVGDLKGYTERYQTIINTLLTQATFNTVDAGNMDYAYALSAVAIARISANRAKMQAPRIDAISQLLQRSNQMRIRELQALGESVKLGLPGHQRTYNLSDLDGAYTIKYDFFSTTNEDLAAQAAIANGLGSLVSEDYKRREILHLPNPDGEMEKQRAELAEKSDPIISLIKQGHALIDQGTDEADLEARRILQVILGRLKQERLAETQPLQGNLGQDMNARPNPTQALPLFGGGQSKGA